MHKITSDGAEKALAGLRRDSSYEHESALRENEARNNAALADVEDAALPPMRTAKDNPCPDCGWPVTNWWSGNHLSPGDVDPRADCTNPNCDWGY